MRSALIFAMTIAMALVSAKTATARTDRELTYRPSQIWNSAVRFIRVDQGFKILEKDKDSAYLLFEYTDGGRPYQASFEMVPVVKDNKRLVRVRFTISQMPSYVEVVLADAFLRKLKDDHGMPPAPREISRSAAMSETEAAAGVEKGAKTGKGKQIGDAKDSTEDTEDEEDVDEDDLQIIEDDLDDGAKED